MAKKVEDIIKIVEDYEAKLRKQGTISTKIDLKLSKKSLKDFLVDFFYYNHASRNDSRCPIPGFNGTYWADENGKVKSPDGSTQCRLGARRSIGDLFQIALCHYSKEVTLIEVMEAVMSIINTQVIVEPKDQKYKYQMYSSVCTGIHRRVFNIVTYGGKSNFNFSTSNPEFSTGHDVSYDEFSIVMGDYLTLEYTGTFKSYREAKDKDRAKRKVVISQDEDELDRLVKAKLAELLSGGSEIVKPVKKKLKKVA